MDVNEEIKKQILSQGLFKGKILTGSMEPVIKIGEPIVVSVKEQELKRFDIILFIQDQKLVCHYLWSLNKIVKPRLMQTRNMSGGRDFPIKEEDYMGKVISHRLSLWRILKIILF